MEVAMRLKSKKRNPEDDASFRTCDMEIISLFEREVSFFF